MCVFSNLPLDQLHMDIEDICVVYLQNVSFHFTLLHDELHTDIMVFLQNVSWCRLKVPARQRKLLEKGRKRGITTDK